MENKDYMFDIDKLRELMDDYGDNISSLANYLGVSRQNLSQVLQGGHGFTYAQIVKIAKKYDLNPDEFFKIFVDPALEKV